MYLKHESLYITVYFQCGVNFLTKVFYSRGERLASKFGACWNRFLVRENLNVKSYGKSNALSRPTYALVY